MAGIWKRFRRVYRKYFGRSFFYKIFWVYLGITVATGLIMFMAISQNLVKEQAEEIRELIDSFEEFEGEEK